jgi:glutathione S-transferase
MENNMPNLKLSYFDFHGGRGEPIRLALWIGNIPFEDDRFPLSEWPSLRKQTPFHQTPVFEIDGETITQANAISRYAAKLAGLYPENPLEAAYCDEVMDAVEDILSKVVVTFRIEDDEEKRLAREALANGPISLYLATFERMLVNRGGDYFAGNRMTIADLKVFVWVRSLRSGILDHIPADLVDRVAPLLVRHFERVSAHPDILAYYQEHQ